MSNLESFSLVLRNHFLLAQRMQQLPCSSYSTS